MVWLRPRTSRPVAGFIAPCLPSLAKAPPKGSGWLHEIKHDGFRIMARRDAGGVRLLTRQGNDMTRRFPLITAAIEKLSARSCVIDGEAIVCDESGLAVFDLIRGHGTVASTTLCAFDLIELDGTDYRLTPIEDRKRALRKLLRKASSGVVINEHFEDERRDHIPRSLPARLRRYCVEAARLAVPIGPIQAMDQGQEPGCAGRAARG